MALLGATAEEINRTMGLGDGISRGFFIVCCKCGRADRVKVHGRFFRKVVVRCEYEDCLNFAIIGARRTQLWQLLKSFLQRDRLEVNIAEWL